MLTTDDAGRPTSIDDLYVNGHTDGTVDRSHQIEGGADQWALLGGNAQSGSLATDFSGVRPSGYNPIRYYDYELYLEPNDGTTQFALDATFCPRAGNSGANYSFLSYNYS